MHVVYDWTVLLGHAEEVFRPPVSTRPNPTRVPFPPPNRDEPCSDCLALAALTRERTLPFTIAVPRRAMVEAASRVARAIDDEPKVRFHGDDAAQALLRHWLETLGAGTPQSLIDAELPAEGPDLARAAALVVSRRLEQYPTAMSPGAWRRYALTLAT